MGLPPSKWIYTHRWRYKHNSPLTNAYERSSMDAALTLDMLVLSSSIGSPSIE